MERESDDGAATNVLSATFADDECPNRRCDAIASNVELS